MSGTGGIELLYGVFMMSGYLIKGAAYLVGGAVYLAGKGAIAAGRTIYSAYRAAEDRRLARAKDELATVTGELGAMAVQRHEALARAEKELSVKYEAAVTERERNLDEAHARLVGTERNMEEIVMALPAYYEERHRLIDDAVKAEITGFSEDLNETCDSMAKTVKASLQNKQKQTMDKLDGAAAALEARSAGYRDYALSAKLSADALLAAVTRTYDCETFAKAELAAATGAKEQVEQLLERGDGASLRAAAMIASGYETYVQTLQIRAEQRTAVFNHQKAALEARAKELEKIAQATHNITAGSEEGMLDTLVSDACDAAFWSDGALPRLWKKAENLSKQAAAFAYQDGQDATLLASSLERTRQELEREHARVRAFLVSRLCMEKMADDTVESMEEAGWTLTGCGYHKNAVGQEDERLPIQMTFNRDGDEMTIILYDEYDPATGQYKQGFTRYSNEEGMISEQERAEEDSRITAAMEARGHKGFKLTCNRATAGNRYTNVNGRLPH